MMKIDNERLDLLDRNLILLCSDEVHLVEKSKDGETDLTVRFSNNILLLLNMEKHTWGYFSNKKCADYLLLEELPSGYRAHIFEMKRSVNFEAWNDMKKQFSGGLQQLLCLSGVLDFSIDLSEIRLYSVYRNDKINSTANPSVMRLQMHEKSLDWNDSVIVVDFMGNRKFKHEKISLNQKTGEGTFELPSA